MVLKEFVNNVIDEYLDENLFASDNTIKKHEKLINDAVINYLKGLWNFDANIVVKKKQNNKLYGDISLTQNSVYNNNFILHFNPNQSFISIIKSFFHEMTHIKQVSKKELRPSDDWKNILWLDNFSISVHDYNKIKDFNTYNKLPWEVEAYKNMNDITLRDNFLKSNYWLELSGKDATLDFIIDNI